MTLDSHSAEETEALGRRVAKALRGGETIALCGAIGAGKTTWVHGLAAGLGIAGQPSSPTFILQQWYRGRQPAGTADILICHIDLYRLETEAEIERLGLFEPLDSRQVTVIEWADRAGRLLPPDRLNLTFQTPVDAANDDARTIVASSSGREHHHLLAALETAP